MIGLLLAAVLANFATRIEPSLAAFLTVAVLVASLLSIKTLRNNQSYFIGGLAVLTSINFVLRSSELVLVTSVFSVLTLIYMLIFQVYGATFQAWILRGFETINQSFGLPKWLSQLLPKSSRNMNYVPIIRGIAIATVVLIPVVLLLASADEVFASILNPVSFETNIFGHLLSILFFFGLFLLFGFMASRTDKYSSFGLVGKKDQKSYSVEKLILLVALTVCLGIWCAVQLTVAMGGATQIFAENDLTRAEYARSGFFQLVAVVVIVISVIAALNFLQPEKENRGSFLKALKVLLVIETSVLVLVGFSRMRLYVDAFGLTLARLFVTWFLAWLLILLFAYGVRLVTANAFGAKVPIGFLSAAVLVMLFGFSNPENQIVETNLSKASELTNTDRQVDMRYLFKDTDLTSRLIIK